MTTSPAESAIGVATPRSTTAGPRFGRGSATSHRTGTDHQAASRLTVAVFGIPSSGRCRAPDTHPALGGKMRAASILNRFGSG
jgi:hypothetical protein